MSTHQILVKSMLQAIEREMLEAALLGKCEWCSDLVVARDYLTRKKLSAGQREWLNDVIADLV